MATHNLLAQLYYELDEPQGYSSQYKLYKAAKKLDSKITLKDVKSWWATQNIPTRFSLAKTKFPRTTFVTRRANHTWLADLADFSKLYRENKGYKWMLIVQDLFSRKIKALVAQKNKTAKETSLSLDKIFSDEKPKKFLTDQGGEFLGSCKEIYQKHNIHHHTTNDVTQKVAPVERALLVVKQRLFKALAKENTWTWIDKLQSILRAYNRSYNRTLGMTPLQAERRENQSRVFFNTVTRPTTKKLLLRLKFKFPIGQIVRILKDELHAKSYLGRFSDVLYQIYDRKFHTGVPIYYLKELLSGEKVIGIFYQQELIPVTIDPKTLPKIDKIHQMRSDRGREQVLVTLAGENKKRWIDYPG